MKMTPVVTIGKPKKKRETIVFIETPPRPEWFVRTMEHGRKVWYLRLVVTGMLPRRFGPFPSRHKALLALDAILDAVGDCNMNDCADKYLLKRRFHKRWECFTEDAIALATKGGTR